MPDTFAIQHVLNGLQADIARRNTLIRDHVAAAARLEADNATDARHAEVAAALIEQINADVMAAAWAPTNEVAAAALVADNVLIGGIPRQGKTASPRLLATLAAAYACPDCGHLPGCGCDCCPYPMPAVAELQNGGA
ncbi:hypothetical protein ABH926_008137 [Catenulispora sp. GP43]|uniref:hypothetical protein n=1 Tax=Catenulispora sp. GP43 TaxID=3156263 RepID=UPI00351974F9